MSAFQDKLVEIRTEKGYTQEKLAELLGISRDKLSKWENGVRFPDLNELLKICDIFDCDLDYLVGKIEQPTHSLQDISDITGLSIESIKLLQKWKNSSPDDPFAVDDLGDPLCLNTEYLNTFLKLYPELLHDINKALTSDTTKNNRFPLSGINPDRVRKILCMKVALELWNYASTGSKNTTTLGTEKISRFASDFIYERLSELENALHHKINQNEQQEE